MTTHVVGDAPELRDIVPTESNTNQAFFLFSSPEAMARHVKAIPDSEKWCHSVFGSGDPHFYGVSTHEAYKMSLAGWPEGAERVAKLRDRINAAHPTMRAPSRWGVAGAIPSVPRYLAGNPQHMKMIDVAKARRKPIITLIANIGANCGVAASAITNRAAVYAAIVDAIESAGFACHVVAVNSTRSGNLTVTCAATIKESHMQADIGRIAYGLGHVSYLRRLNFGCKGGDRFCQPLGHGLGMPINTPTKDLDAGTYVLPSMNGLEGKFISEDDAATVGLDHMLGVLRQQGCPAFPTEEDAA